MRRHAKSLCKVMGEQLDSTQPLVGVEVGVWKGELSRDLLASFPNLFLHMVDLWSPVRDEFTMHAKDNTKEAMLEALICAMRNTEEFRDRRKLHQMSGEEASARFADLSLNMVFVDADHFYESVKADVEAWWPKVKAGGILAGHDYDGQGDRRKGWGVKRAVDEFCVELGVFPQVEPGLVWWIQK